mgnify:CR=1 FL=1
MELKKRCNFTYYNVVHLYRKRNVTLKEEVDTRVMAGVLWDLKLLCGRKIMLIPLQADANLTSIEAFVKEKNVTQFPATIIDGKVIQGLASLQELRELVGC